MNQTDNISASAFASLALPAPPEPLSVPPKPLSFFSIPLHWNAKTAYDDLPPFLFRVSHPKSFARLGGGWALSRDASSPDNYESSRLGLGPRSNEEVAAALNRHLWWLDTEPGHSNFVSWTTSLLFALKFAFYNKQQGTPSECIKLCMVNTQKFPKGVFVRDIYLIGAYKHYLPTYEQRVSGDGKTLTSLLDLRTQGLYFGEFLSQGALGIDGKSCIVSLSDLEDRGLLWLLPELDAHDKELQLARWVLNERTKWLADDWMKWSDVPLSPRLPVDLGRLVDLFEPDFRLAAATALLSLEPRDPRDHGLMWDMVQVVTRYPDDATLKHYYSRQHTDDLEMPEVNQYSTIITNLAIILERRKELLVSTRPATALTQTDPQVEAESAQGSMAIWEEAWRRAYPDLKKVVGSG
ncbi:hypothetical protein RB601_004548 [Gaeumannomyces tritici]